MFGDAAARFRAAALLGKAAMVRPAVVERDSATPSSIDANRLYVPALRQMVRKGAVGNGLRTIKRLAGTVR
jgi:hypothetical protein